MLECPHTGTAYLRSRLQQVIPTLVACKGLHEFGHELSDALVETLASDVVGFYLYSKSTNSFSPVSTVLTTPNSSRLDFPLSSWNVVKISFGLKRH